MNEAHHHRAALRLPTACGVLGLAIALTAALTGAIAHARTGAVGSAAVVVAALSCGLSAMAALVLAGMLAGTRWGVHGIMGAGIIRFLLPLFVVASSAAVQGPLSRAGLFGYMVVFFLVALVVETLLLVGVLRSTDSNKNSVAWKGH